MREEYRKAVKLLKEGEIVALPTETVYGLVGYFYSSSSLDKIFALKGRPENKPLALFISSPEEMRSFSSHIHLSAWLLAYRFWPGPLTLVLSSKPGTGIPWVTVGFRIPQHPVPLKILSLLSPLWSTSANLTGKRSAVTYEEVKEYFAGKIPLILKDGREPLGKESTVVDVSGEEIKILREGSLEVGEIKKALNIRKVLFVCSGNTCRSLIAEKIFEKMSRGKFEVSSAGIHAYSASKIPYEVNRILQKEGIKDISHNPVPLTEELVKEKDLIFTMESFQRDWILEKWKEAKGKVFLLTSFTTGEDIKDPRGKGYSFYLKTLSKIKENLVKLIEELEDAYRFSQ